jgi:hypothetical protein
VDGTTLVKNLCDIALYHSSQQWRLHRTHSPFYSYVARNSAKDSKFLIQRSASGAFTGSVKHLDNSISRTFSYTNSSDLHIGIRYTRVASAPELGGFDIAIPT